MEKKPSLAPKTEFSAPQLKIAMDTMKDLMKDPSLAKQRKHLELIQKTISKSTENERRISQKYRKLRTELLANSSKIKAAIQLAEEDKSTINTLKNELEKAWKIIEELQLKPNIIPKVSNESAFSIVSRLGLSSKESLVSEYSTNKKLQEEILRMKMEEKRWGDENQSLKSKLEKEIQESSRLRNENSKLQQENNNLMNMSNEHKKISKKYELKVKTLEKLELDLVSIKAENTNLVSENEKCKLQIFELEEELASKEKKEEEHKAENKKNESRKQNEEGRKLLNDYPEGLASKSVTSLTEAVIHKTNRKCEKLEVQLKNMIKVDKVNRAHLKHIKRELQRVSDVLNAVKSERSSLEKELEEALRINAALTTENEILRSDLAKSGASIKDLEDIKDNYCHQIGKLEEKVLSFKSRLEKLERCNYTKQIANLEKELLIVSNKWQEECKNSIELKAALTEKQKEMEKLNVILKEYERFLKQTNDEIDDKMPKQCLENFNGSGASQSENKYLPLILQDMSKKIIFLIELVNTLITEKEELRLELEQENQIQDNYFNEMPKDEQFKSKITEENSSDQAINEESYDTDIESANESYSCENSLSERTNKYLSSLETDKSNETKQGDLSSDKELSEMERSYSRLSISLFSDTEKLRTPSSDTFIDLSDYKPVFSTLPNCKAEFPMKRSSSMEFDSRLIKRRLQPISKSPLLPSKDLYLKNDHKCLDIERLNKPRNIQKFQRELKSKKMQVHEDITPQVKNIISIRNYRGKYENDIRKTKRM